MSPSLALGYRRHSLWLAENGWLPRAQHTKVAKVVRHLPTKGCEGIGDGRQRALELEGGLDRSAFGVRPGTCDPEFSVASDNVLHVQYFIDTYSVLV